MAAHRNPFRVQRTDALAYRPQGTTWAQMLAELEAMDFRGAIVGPHGTGKTTLIASLVRLLHERGFDTQLIHLTQAEPRIARGEWQTLRATDNTVVIVDGAERLNSVAWLRLRRHTHRAAGLIITTHTPGRLPTWVTTRTSASLLGELIEELHPACSLDPAALFHASAGNLRTALRQCYAQMS